MTNINELRRLAQAAANGPFGYALKFIPHIQRFQEAANPAAVSELIGRLEAAENERDNYKRAYNEWIEKTEWVQLGIGDGSISPKYLGQHRADIVKGLLEAAEKDAACFRKLRAACGDVCAATDTTITIFQDDATQDWIVKEGRQRCTGSSLREAINALKTDDENG